MRCRCQEFALFVWVGVGLQVRRGGGGGRHGILVLLYVCTKYLHILLLVCKLNASF